MVGAAFSIVGGKHQQWLGGYGEKETFCGVPVLMPNSRVVRHKSQGLIHDNLLTVFYFLLFLKAFLKRFALFKYKVFSTALTPGAVRILLPLV